MSGPGRGFHSHNLTAQQTGLLCTQINLTSQNYYYTVLPEPLYTVVAITRLDLLWKNVLLVFIHSSIWIAQTKTDMEM